MENNIHIFMNNENKRWGRLSDTACNSKLKEQNPKQVTPWKIQKSHQTKTKCFQNLQKPSGVK